MGGGREGERKTMPEAELRTAYAGASALTGPAAAPHLTLLSDVAATPEPVRFLEAVATAPEVTAKALRAVSEIVGARFYVPPSMLARILREADPVVTVGPRAVRFEGFSACCSAYIRHDMGDGALEVSARRNGTTNVDFGAELRGSLAGVRAGTRLGLTIGPEAVGIANDGAEIVERKVPLPERWIRGFGEVQVAMAGMRPAFTLPRISAQRFLRALPRSKSDHLQWVSLRGREARSAARETPGAVPLRGAHRLRVLDPLAPAASALHVYRNPRLGSTAWVLELGPQRLGLVLNLEPWRGFSGDGGLLSELAREEDGALAALRAQLGWQDRLDQAALAETTGLTQKRVETGLARLAALGLVGYDLAEGAYFHRALPFDLDRVQALNPRLEDARALLARGAVRLAEDRRSAEVASADVLHRVEVTPEGLRCTCPWHARTGGARGACKHALAVEIVLEGGA